MTYRDLFELAADKGVEDTEVVVYDDCEGEFYEAKKAMIVKKEDVEKNLILGTDAAERVVVVV